MVKAESAVLEETAVNQQEQKELSDAAQIRYLTPANCMFYKTTGNMLAVKADEEEFPVVYLHCSFPHKNDRIYISVRTGDNKEVGMIQSIDDFPAETASLLEEQIRVRYYTPSITKVIKIREEFGYSYWETETTAGACRFTVRAGGTNVKPVTDCKLLITDVNGNRFVIEDVEQLSDKEYRMVEMCM